MPDEDNPVLQLLQQQTHKVDAQGAKLESIAQAQSALHVEMNANFAITDARLERMEGKLDIAVARANDVMSSQVKLATEVRALRVEVESR